jgi:TrmH family RNA methyltransferase
VGRRSARTDEGVFVVEGEHLIEQAVAAGWEVEALFVAPGGVPVACGAPVHHMAPNVIERIASTDSPRPVLATVRRRERQVPEGVDLVVVGDRLADPGNVGTIIRSAEAVGAGAVVLTPGSVDAYSPKVVRSTAGSLFRIPVVTATLAEVRDLGLTLLGTSSHRGTSHTATDLRRAIAVVVGNEAHGLADDADVDEWITVRQPGPVESLNVAMATTVILFEVVRQRAER